MKDDTPHAAEPCWLAIEEFVSSGLLQEVNRQFFHPLGLALAVKRENGGLTGLAGVIDGRDDEEGFVYEQFTDAEATRPRPAGRAGTPARHPARATRLRRGTPAGVSDHFHVKVAGDRNEARSYVVREHARAVIEVNREGDAGARDASGQHQWPKRTAVLEPCAGPCLGRSLAR